VGRETHTFLYHIIENYDNLADVTIFFSGSIDLDNKYSRSKKVVENVERTNNTVFSGIEWDNSSNYNFKLDNWLSTHGKNNEINKDAKLQESDIRPYGEWFKSTFKNGEENTFIAWNSIISVSRENIIQKPKSYYENLIKMVDNHQRIHDKLFF
jgi:hypothetical protein